MMHFLDHKRHVIGVHASSAAFALAVQITEGDAQHGAAFSIDDGTARESTARFGIENEGALRRTVGTAWCDRLIQPEDRALRLAKLVTPPLAIGDHLLSRARGI